MRASAHRGVLFVVEWEAAKCQAHKTLKRDPSLDPASVNRTLNYIQFNQKYSLAALCCSNRERERCPFG